MESSPAAGPEAMPDAELASLRKELAEQRALHQEKRLAVEEGRQRKVALGHRVCLAPPVRGV